MALSLAMAINGGLNEDEAFRSAATLSLEEQAHPRPVDRDGSLSDAIITRARQIVDLTDRIEEKMCRLRAMTFETRLPKDKPIPVLPKTKQPQKDDASLSSSQRIRRQQDAEYEEALQQAQREEAARIAEEEVRTAQEEEEVEAPQEQYAEMIMERVAGIGPEPAEGITIAVQLPSMVRLSRRFAEDATGEVVCVWAAGQAEVQTAGFRLGTFDLIGPDGVLDGSRNLRDQIQGRRTLLNLVSRQ